MTELRLNDPSLLAERARVGSRWVDASDGERAIDEINPATGEVIGRVPNLGAAETVEAIADAQRAQKDWAKRTAKERSQILRRWYDLMMENQDDLGAMLTAEQGKPLAEAKGEIA
jgi:succinate-semialdehyde dehydrogenase/glutarate-semialdehyde dehydrogenase